MGKSDVIAHNVKFYNLETRAIHCMALDRTNNKLALSRSDSSIEIWDVRYNPHLQKVIFKDSNSSIEDIKWVDSRLFVCGLDGYIHECDCKNESFKQSVAVTGGPAWCIDINANRKLLACGTEDGYINIYDLDYEKLEFFKFLDKQQGRILSICWDKPGQHIVTGSVDVIRVWNVDTGHAIHKMKTGRNQHNKETVVWCVKVTSDLTIISGDSRGYLCFWDGKIGAQIESINSHAADILSLALTEDESTVYCAGVDPSIVLYGRIIENSGGRRKWAKGGQRRIHEHDVRALALTKDNKLFTGGIDGFLALSSFPPKVLIKFPPLLQNPFISIASSKKLLLLKYLTHLELWKLGEPVSNQNTCDSLLLLKEKEVQLLQLKACKNEVIISAALSEDGQFIAYSTEKSLRFYKFTPEDVTTLLKLPKPSDCGPCRLINFFNVAKRHFCACVTKKNEINILEVEETGPDVVHTIKPLENQVLTDTISYLAVSSDSSYVAAGDCESNIAVWSRSNWNLYCNLPKYQASITALSFRPDENVIVVAYSDFKVIEFDLKKQQCTKFSKSLEDSLLTHLHTPIRSIAFDRRRNNSVIIHDDISICVLYEDEGDVNDISKLKLKKTNGGDPAIKNQLSCNSIKKPKFVVGVFWLNNNEMVIVSLCPLKLTENLPPTLEKKLFGT